MKLLNQKMLAERLGIHRITIWRLVRSGKLIEPMTVGKVQLWPEDQIDKYISEQDSTMTTIEQNLSEARQAMKTVGDNHRAMQNDLYGLKSKLFGAADHNSTEIEDRADALADGIERDDNELIDVKALQEEIQVKELTLKKLTERVNDAKAAVKEASEIIMQHQKRDARQLLRDKFGFDAARNKFRMDKLAELDGNGIMDMHTTARLAWGNVRRQDLCHLIVVI